MSLQVGCTHAAQICALEHATNLPLTAANIATAWRTSALISDTLPLTSIVGTFALVGCLTQVRLQVQSLAAW